MHRRRAEFAFPEAGEKADSARTSFLVSVG
jgi:hypothetical protein